MLTVLAVFTLSGCDSSTEWRSGKYSVYWIDVSLNLGIDTGDGASIGRVMHRVCSVGEDDRWIVAARYPGGDKTRKEYYYFSKAADHPFKNADEIVLGPLTESEFMSHKTRLSLPDFEKHF
ncbi:MAG: hypothetical protein QE267_11055 [Akkermansiaceae bacterium]|jgi:hypothetical protein|nr:hypothetical protein [Akkermansiaceae bacterium]